MRTSNKRLNPKLKLKHYRVGMGLSAYRVCHLMGFSLYGVCSLLGLSHYDACRLYSVCRIIYGLSPIMRYVAYWVCRSAAPLGFHYETPVD